MLFQTFSKPLPDTKPKGIARSLSLLIRKDGVMWIEWGDNQGLWHRKIVTADYAERLVRSAGLVEIKQQEIQNGN